MLSYRLTIQRVLTAASLYVSSLPLSSLLLSLSSSLPLYLSLEEIFGPAYFNFTFQHLPGHGQLYCHRGRTKILSPGTPHRLRTSLPPPLHGLPGFGESTLLSSLSLLLWHKTSRFSTLNHNRETLLSIENVL